MTFTPGRLLIARERRSLSRVALAKAVGLTTTALAKLEKGETEEPRAAHLLELSKTLGFPPLFFELDEPVRLSEATFRSLARMSASSRKSALAGGSLALDIDRYLQTKFDYPEVDIPDLGGVEPQAAAEAIRAEWKLGEMTIGNMVHLLESKGVRVFSLCDDCREIDAFSIWVNDLPYVFLNTMKTPERGRMDAAHELGHLLLHRHATHGKEIEREADLFAANFLMPKKTVLATAPRFPDMRQLIEKKTRFKVSLMAYCYRLHKMELMSDWHYRSLCIEIRRTFGNTEPNGIPREKSERLPQSFKVLSEEDGISANMIAKKLGIPFQEFKELLFNDVIVEIGGNCSKTQVGSRAQLELVQGGQLGN